MGTAGIDSVAGLGTHDPRRKAPKVKYGATALNLPELIPAPDLGREWAAAVRGRPSGFPITPSPGFYAPVYVFVGSSDHESDPANLMFSLGLALAGPANAGKVIAWVGMAMFAALASGAPLGTVLYGFGGFASIGIATALIPMATMLLVAPLAPSPPRPGTRSHLLKVAHAVWIPGFGSALSSVGFGAMIAFSSLLSAERSWNPVWLLFSSFAAAWSWRACSSVTFPTGSGVLGSR